MKNTSLKKNATLNVIRVLMSIIFPLITFPYASRTLGADNIGKVQFASSIIVFVGLFASLGVSNYAIREGAGLRDNRKRMSLFASSIFSLNLFFTLLSYLGLFVILLLPTKLSDYSFVILILSIQVFFTTLGVDWINTIYEDYLYITVRSIFSQIISLILLFIFVKKRDDYCLYAAVTVIANSGVNILNFFHAKKYVDLRITLKNDFRKHIKPLIILFSNNLAQQIYINSDSVMLGFLADDYSVGLYSVAVKIYTIVKTLLNAFITVAIPRMAYYSSKSPEEFENLVEKIFKSSILVLLPIMTILFLLSDNVVLFLSGKGYIAAGLSVKILSIGLIFAVFANLFCNGILIVKKQEKVVLQATFIAAIVNFSFNFIFIKLFKQNGASITTVLAEFIVMFYTYLKSKKYFKLKNFLSEFVSEIIACIGIICIYLLVHSLKFGNFTEIIIASILGIAIYCVILFALRNKTFLYFLNEELNKLGIRNN